MKVQILSGILSICLISFGLTYLGLTGGIMGNVGYCLVFLLTSLGFKKLNIDLSEWISWIKIPSIVFLSSCISTFLLQDSILLKMAAGGVQFICITIWFLRCNPKVLGVSHARSID